MTIDEKLLDNPVVWEKLQTKLLAVRTLAFGLTAPIGCPQEIWNVVILKAFEITNDPIVELEDL